MRDPEAFARDALAKGIVMLDVQYLNAVERDDALQYLIADLWWLGERFDPAKATKPFIEWAAWILPRRLASWYRKRFGDYRHAGRRDAGTTVGLPDDQLVEDAALEALGSIDIVRLSPAARRTHDEIVCRMVSDGLTREQLALELGWPRRRVAQALTDWREEVETKCLAS